MLTHSNIDVNLLLVVLAIVSTILPIAFIGFVVYLLRKQEKFLLRIMVTLKARTPKELAEYLESPIDLIYNRIKEIEEEENLR